MKRGRQDCADSALARIRKKAALRHRRRLCKRKRKAQPQTTVRNDKEKKEKTHAAKRHAGLLCRFPGRENKCRRARETNGPLRERAIKPEQQNKERDIRTKGKLKRGEGSRRFSKKKSRSLTRTEGGAPSIRNMTRKERNRRGGEEGPHDARPKGRPFFSGTWWKEKVFLPGRNAALKGDEGQMLSRKRSSSQSKAQREGRRAGRRRKRGEWHRAQRKEERRRKSLRSGRSAAEKGMPREKEHLLTEKQKKASKRERRSGRSRGRRSRSGKTDGEKRKAVEEPKKRDQAEKKKQN